MLSDTTTESDSSGVAATQPATSADGRSPSGRSLRPGRVLHGYRIERHIGGGGFAEVFQVTTPLDATLAMKVLRGPVAALPEERARFRWEPRFMNAVKHPGVPRALADGVAPDGRPYFVMDWIGGETLEERATRLGGRLPLREVEKIGFHLAGILEAAHAAGVLHLDVKPENVFASRDGRILLADFGIARWRDEADAGNAMRGTPMFMAPEQLRGTGLGPWTDVHALGVTLFVLLTGRPVCATAALRSTFGMLYAPARPLLSVMPSAPLGLACLIDLCLSPNPAARPTPRELRHAFRRMGVVD